MSFSKKGFTLIEMIVTLFIIGLVSTVVISSFRGSDQGFALERSAHRLAQDIRHTQEKAMSVMAPEGAPGEDFRGGYGLFVGETESFFYVDLDDVKYCTNPQCRLSDFNLEKGVTIEKVLLDDVEKTSLYLTFIPPDPAVFIISSVGSWGSGDNPCSEVDCYGEAKIILQIPDAGKKAVTINTGGLITVEDYE